MKICEKCGKKYNDDYQFCEEDGQKLIYFDEKSFNEEKKRKVIKKSGGIAKIILGIPLLLIGLAIFIEYSAFLVLKNEIKSQLFFIYSPHYIILGLIPLSLVSYISALIILIAGINLSFTKKKKIKIPIRILASIWVIALIVFSFTFYNEHSSRKESASVEENNTILSSGRQMLYLKLSPDLYESMINEKISLNRMKMATIGGEEKLLGQPILTIEKNNSNEYLLLINKRARGRSTVDAQKNAEEIDYNFIQKDSTILFDSYYILKGDARWRNQEVSIILKVPVGKAIYMDDDMVKIIHDIENVSNTWDGDMVGKFWEMKPEGLTLK